MLHESVFIDVQHRQNPLELAIFGAVAPSQRAPIIIFSHGDKIHPVDYQPLCSAWLNQGFFIVAPVHATEPDQPIWWQRACDLHAAIDYVHKISNAPGLGLDISRIFVAGHSFGGHSAMLILGAIPFCPRPDNRPLAQPAVKAGILLAPPGEGGAENLYPQWVERAPYLKMDWSNFKLPALFIVGRDDTTPITSRDWRWHADGFFQSPNCNKHLIIAEKADHYLGGIVASRGRQNPSQLQFVAAISAQFLRHARLEEPLIMPAEFTWQSGKAAVPQSTPRQ